MLDVRFDEPVTVDYRETKSIAVSYVDPRGEDAGLKVAAADRYDPLRRELRAAEGRPQPPAPSQERPTQQHKSEFGPP